MTPAQEIRRMQQVPVVVGGPGAQRIVWRSPVDLTRNAFNNVGPVPRAINPGNGNK
jgi:hypothetical protein